MTQLPNNYTNRADAKPSSDIYTVLVIAATLALIAAIGFIWYRSGVVFGTSHPFEIRQASAAVGSMLGLG